MKKRFSTLSVVALVLVGAFAGMEINELVSGDDIYLQLGKLKDVLVLTEMPAQDPEKPLAIDGEERELLAKMLAAINLSFDKVYLASLVKCGLAGPPPPTSRGRRSRN